MTPVQQALLEIERDLQRLGRRWALIGGLAVSLRAEPRTTQDVDVALAVRGDEEAERIAGALLSRNYRFEQSPLEQLDVGRLATVRLVATKAEIRGVVIDLMFASSGIEEEVVVASDMLEVMPGVAVPVATTAHLLALKTLAGRLKDVTDFAALVQYASQQDLLEAREALALITERGFSRGKDLQVKFAELLEGAPREI